MQRSANLRRAVSFLAVRLIMKPMLLTWKKNVCNVTIIADSRLNIEDCETSQHANDTSKLWLPFDRQVNTVVFAISVKQTRREHIHKDCHLVAWRVIHRSGHIKGYKEITDPDTTYLNPI